MLESRTSRLARPVVLGALVAAASVAPAAATEPATIAFQAHAASSDQYTRMTPGVFTLSLHGGSGATVAGHQSGGGHWPASGGTGAYRRLHGHGRWETDTEFRAGPSAMLLPAMRGAFTGDLHPARRG